MRVDDKARDLVALIRNDSFVEKNGQRQIGEGHLGSDTLDRAARRNTGKFVAGARGCRLGEQVLEIAEGIGDAVDGMVQRHKFPRGR